MDPIIKYLINQFSKKYFKVKISQYTQYCSKVMLFVKIVLWCAHCFMISINSAISWFNDDAKGKHHLPINIEIEQLKHSITRACY